MFRRCSPHAGQVAPGSLLESPSCHSGARQCVTLDATFLRLFFFSGGRAEGLYCRLGMAWPWSCWAEAGSEDLLLKETPGHLLVTPFLPSRGGGGRHRQERREVGLEAGGRDSSCCLSTASLLLLSSCRHRLGVENPGRWPANLFKASQRRSCHKVLRA